MKDKAPYEEQHDLLSRVVCATNNYIEDYIGEIVTDIVESAQDHNGRGPHSHLVKHVIENNHLPAVKGDITILDSGYKITHVKGK